MVAQPGGKCYVSVNNSLHRKKRQHESSAAHVGVPVVNASISFGSGRKQRKLQLLAFKVAPEDSRLGDRRSGSTFKARMKGRQRSGFKVVFAAARPAEICANGGDSRQPSINVSAWQRSRRRRRPQPHESRVMSAVGSPGAGCSGSATGLQQRRQQRRRFNAALEAEPRDPQCSGSVNDCWPKKLQRLASKVVHVAELRA